MNTYDPKVFFEDRLSKHFDLEGVGCYGRGDLYNRLLYKSKVRTMERALKKITINLTKSSMLDIGTGVGFWVEYFLAKSVHHITGVDITEISIKKLKEKYQTNRTDFFSLDISQKDFPTSFNDQFDLVTAMDIIYHITDDNRFSIAISNISRCIKPGGYLIVTDVFSKDRTIDTAAFVKNRSEQVWAAELKKNKFEVVTILPMYVLLCTPIEWPEVLKKILYLTNHVAESSSMTRKLYYYGLYKIDSILTHICGPSVKLLVAKRL